MQLTRNARDKKNRALLAGFLLSFYLSFESKVPKKKVVKIDHFVFTFLAK